MGAARHCRSTARCAWKALGDPALTKIVDQLDQWSNEAAFKPVFDFYAGVLGRDGIRRKLVARLGPEAGDILDEFLNFCLAQEKTGTPGLEAFLATLESAAPEVKREMDQGRAEVRIMTAHAAKGLEAPVVFLVDNGARPFSEQHLPRLLPFDATGKFWQGKGLSVARGRRHRQRQFAHRRGAHQGSGRGRIPAAALCRHDAGRGSPHRLRLFRQATADRRHLARAGQRRARRRAGGRSASRTRCCAGTRHRYRVVKQPPTARAPGHRDASRCRRQRKRRPGSPSRCRQNRCCRGR